MKAILILILIISSLNASYKISYSKLKIGVIKDISTVNQNYLDIKVTNKIARLLLGKKKMLFFNDEYVGSKSNKSYKYKKDKYFIIAIVKNAISNNLKEGRIYTKKNKYIEISKDENYKFKYVSKGKVKSYGTLVIKDSELISLIDEKNHVKIVKN